jgi:hypothetical protein
MRKQLWYRQRVMQYWSRRKPRDTLRSIVEAEGNDDEDDDDDDDDDDEAKDDDDEEEADDVDAKRGTGSQTPDM